MKASVPSTSGAGTTGIRPTDGGSMRGCPRGSAAHRGSGIDQPAGCLWGSRAEVRRRRRVPIAARSAVEGSRSTLPSTIGAGTRPFTPESGKATYSVRSPIPASPNAPSPAGSTGRDASGYSSPEVGVRFRKRRPATRGRGLSAILPQHLPRGDGIPEIIYEVREDAVDGGYSDTALGYGIHTQGDSVQQIRRTVKGAAARYSDHASRCRKSISRRAMPDDML